METNREDVRIVFVHIPKTAGMSLFNALAKVVGKERAIRFAQGNKTEQDRYLAMSEEQVRSYHLISGHFKMPIFLRQPISDYKFITVIRDPVDRELSAYFYMKTHTEHPQHHSIRKVDLYEYLERREGSMKNGNPQCRFVSGSDRFEDARRAIEEDYFLVAPVEYLGEFYGELSRRLGFQSVRLARNNVTKFRLGAHEIHPDIKRRFEALTSEDLALYEYVKQRWEQQEMSTTTSSGT